MAKYCEKIGDIQVRRQWHANRHFCHRNKKGENFLFLANLEPIPWKQ